MSAQYIVCSSLGNTTYHDDVNNAIKEAINESLSIRTTVFVYDTHDPDYGSFTHYANARVGCYRFGKEVSIRTADV